MDLVRSRGSPRATRRCQHDEFAKQRTIYFLKFTWYHIEFTCECFVDYLIVQFASKIVITLYFCVKKQDAVAPIPNWPECSPIPAGTDPEHLRDVLAKRARLA
jgi:hypothetical protein